ncbi:MAG: hypothetical protein K6G25_04035 [Bacteroidales bacterium]|nr:hypothetical protein [Bacteroidales bacterium]
MTRKSTLYAFFTLAVFSLAFASCKKFEGSQTIPAYIHIDSITVNCDYFVYGANSSKITDAWVFIDDNPIGCYELPTTFPILKHGPHKVTVSGGIMSNGIGAVRSTYPFYKPLVYENLNLVEDSIINLQPVLNYFPIGEGVEKGWMEDFETANTLSPVAGSDTSIVRINGDEAWHSTNSFYSGKIVLPPDSLDFIVATPEEGFTFHQGYLSYCVLEMDYKCNDAFFVGVMYYKDYQLVKHPLVRVQPTDTIHSIPQRWNKIYINIGPVMNENVTASYFRVYFTSDLSVNPVYEEPDYVHANKQRYYYLDNLKLFYRPQSYLRNE